MMEVIIESKGKEECKHFTAFATSKSLYEWNVMPFGLRNAPAHFQKIMIGIFADMLFHGCLVYLDDIVVYGDSIEEFKERLHEVLKRLRRKKLTINPEKCHIGTQEVEYLGWMITQQGRHINPKRLEGIQRLPAPSSRKEASRVIGIFNYFKDVIPLLARLMAPISALTKKDIPFEWTPECQNAFKEIKSQLSKTIVLAPFNENETPILYSDASKVGIGGVLMQQEKKTGKENPICFISKKLSDVQSRWTVGELESYAIVYCILQCD
ncbi:Retrovirus-related Pol polyprotein from transposon 17.6, partial [Aduncisulcus paluster]